MTIFKIGTLSFFLVLPFFSFASASAAPKAEVEADAAAAAKPLAPLQASDLVLKNWVPENYVRKPVALEQLQKHGFDLSGHQALCQSLYTFPSHRYAHLHPYMPFAEPISLANLTPEKLSELKLHRNQREGGDLEQILKTIPRGHVVQIFTYPALWMGSESTHCYHVVASKAPEAGRIPKEVTEKDWEDLLGFWNMRELLRVQVSHQPVTPDCRPHRPAGFLGSLHVSPAVKARFQAFFDANAATIQEGEEEEIKPIY